MTAVDALPVDQPPTHARETCIAIVTILVIFGLFVATWLYATGRIG